jgi:hypothetical protein
MTPEEKVEILRVLDRERQTVIYPGVTRVSDRGVIKDISADEKNCEIVYSSCSEAEVDRVIEHQIQTAQSERYELEWKVYGHDQPHCLGERLAIAGFEAGEREAFLVFFANDDSLNHFSSCSGDIRRVTNKEGLADYRIIREEVCGEDCTEEVEQYEFMLANHPNNMSVYIAYMDGEPAACGRIYFHKSSQFAALYGGNTRERFRKRGLFIQLVAVRIREAVSRRIVKICVDALPTSEPILRKRGFESVTSTQPFCCIKPAQTPGTH